MLFFQKDKTKDELKQKVKELEKDLAVAKEVIEKPEKIFNNLDWSSLFDEPRESGLLAMLPWVNIFFTAIILIMLFVKK